MLSRRLIIMKLCPLLIIYLTRKINISQALLPHTMMSSHTQKGLGKNKVWIKQRNVDNNVLTEVVMKSHQVDILCNYEQYKVACMLASRETRDLLPCS
ncbi:hypothetical protein GLOIN_2v1483942 [Rhizophagus irregularis DAOM 181602=DAOM 197198]|nr:hypothetical protein GLOIN_2v1483942 [Rhizophagus irregularis DAOM 181602=DAOM 197198]